MDDFVASASMFMESLSIPCVVVSAGSVGGAMLTVDKSSDAVSNSPQVCYLLRGPPGPS